MNNSICNKCKNSVLSNSGDDGYFKVKQAGMESGFHTISGNFCKIVIMAVHDIEECEKFEKVIMHAKTKH